METKYQEVMLPGLLGISTSIGLCHGEVCHSRILLRIWGINSVQITSDLEGGLFYVFNDDISLLVRGCYSVVYNIVAWTWEEEDQSKYYQNPFPPYFSHSLLDIYT